MADNYRESFADAMQQAMDPFHKALTVISDEHRLIHDGMVYFAFGNEQDVPDGESREWTFITSSRPVHFKRITIGASEGPVIVSLSENPTISVAGTPTTNVNNLNRMSSRTPTLVINTGVTSTAPGSPIIGDLYVPQQGNQGVTGESSAIEEFILAPNTTYLFTLTNDPAGSGTADIYVNLVFYELDYELP